MLYVSLESHAVPGHQLKLCAEGGHRLQEGQTLDVEFPVLSQK